MSVGRPTDPLVEEPWEAEIGALLGGLPATAQTVVPMPESSTSPAARSMMAALASCTRPRSCSRVVGPCPPLVIDSMATADATSPPR